MLYNYFMEEKYINFYKKFILQTKTLNNCRVVYKEDDTECFRRCLENDKGVALSNCD